MTLSRSLLVLAVAPLCAFAQGVLPGQQIPQAQQQPAGGTQVNGTAGDYKSSTSENMADRLFDVKSDSVDLENGTIQWKGKTFNLGDTRLMRARFERYLATPPPEQEFAKYMQILDEIDRRVSAMNFSDSDSNRLRNLQEAWNLLFEAAKYEYDGNASLTLANQVMKAWRERSEIEDLRISIEQQKLLSKQQADIISNRSDNIAGRNAGNRVITTNNGRGGSTTSTTARDDTGKRELTELEAQGAATKADIAKNSVQQGVMGMQSKLEFQSTIVAYLTQRRFRHCILANAFYRQIYRASHQQVQVGAKELKELFPVSNFVPSLEAIDSIAREAIADVRIGLRAYDQLDTTGERYAAFERLQETYFLGEYEPDVIRLDFAKKRRYVDLVRDVRDLQKFGDERDLEAAEETLARISANAKDFPAARIRSKIRTAKQASNMEVLAAKQVALVSGKDGADKVTEHLAAAGKIWPLNPSIANFATEMTGRANLVSQLMPEFDRLYDGGRMREIFNRKDEFAVALIQDKPRLEKLSAVVNKIGKIELMLSQVDMLSEQGNRYLAWDVLSEAGKTDPTDTKVAGLRAKLAPAVANYAKLIEDGTRAENEGRFAPAIAAYLAAQDINSASPLCQKALERASQALLDAGASAK